MTTIAFLGILQSFLRWHVGRNQFTVCNASGAWPLSLPLLGSGILTLCCTLLLALWAWKSLRDLSLEKRTFFLVGWWALILATGLSHALERLTSGCIIDYWTLVFFSIQFSFNLGDVALTVSVLSLSTLWLWELQKNR